MTDISRTPQPWWRQSLPGFVPSPSSDIFYEEVAQLRKLPYGQRPTSGLLKDKDLLVAFALVVESMGLDKHKAGKFCRLFKLVNSYEQFRMKVQVDHKSLSESLSVILDEFENERMLEEVRRVLLPTKEVTLTPAQKQGYQLLEVLERERTRALERYEVAERDLQSKLRLLRAERDEFGRQLATVIPAWDQVRRCRDSTLSRIEREALVNRFETSSDLKARYTIESYLATARANKVQQAEREVYGNFRRLGNEANVIGQVQEAVSRASGPRPLTGAAQGQAPGVFDDIAPE
jgi:hypothetical protein